MVVMGKVEGVFYYVGVGCILEVLVFGMLMD